MKTTILIFDHFCTQLPNQETYFPELLIAAYEALGYTAFQAPTQQFKSLPAHLQRQAI